MHSEELQARVEQLESEVIVLKHVIRLILAAYRRNLPPFPGPRLDPETVRQVRREIQAQWDQEWRELIPPDPRSL
ncbi:hypothetical protein [Thermoflexus sp.]|uniref:hypothetical protein n=1 Tax=Thermoflexus sp. TaxID=1969742 RepID=UPI0025E16FDC|nr:hypothetical protein [Thermoflexus sp.]MDW8181160.1 hypothetical protein [Anaerolineae bacterium]MCS6964614.1 hypothetical protein [Thermoflexus sp.]MCS7351702.1 hypothetical protein [Thermoflexus sp.]MCX7691383.1 hypothetical protein [Thermoflexus sp.]MDW8185847.1 hypothetical protein [Anaerolineae bacterium]